jgi:hypothetical protein
VLILGLPNDGHRHGVRGRSNYSAEPRVHTVIARIFASSFFGLPEPSGIDAFTPHARARLDLSSAAGSSQGMVSHDQHDRAEMSLFC